MNHATQNRRLWLLGLFLMSLFAGLGYRLVHVQIMRHDELLTRADGMMGDVTILETYRGDILDSRGHTLATSMPVKKVYADPVLLADRHWEVARALAPLLDYAEVATLARMLAMRVMTNVHGALVTNRYVDLKRKVALDQWDRIRQAMSDLRFAEEEGDLTRAERDFFRLLKSRGIYGKDAQQRVYSSRKIAAHVLGFVEDQESRINGVVVNELAGCSGIESAFNSRLAGVRGYRVTERDRKRRELVQFRGEQVEPRSGQNVVLTLDLYIQKVVEEKLQRACEEQGATSGSAIVVRPATGEILSLANWPAFDPNRPGDFPVDYLRNRAIADMNEPGSTFKIVVVGGALNDGVVRMSDSFFCHNGQWNYEGRMLNDSHAYGWLTVDGIVSHSSNIGAAQIGLRMGGASLHRYVLDFGFGHRTGIALGGEAAGIVHPPKDWSRISITRIPMGHEVAVTPLQMVMAMSAIANGGRLMRPQIVKRVEDGEGHVAHSIPPEVVRQVISENTAREMTRALRGVVSTNGTGPRARLEGYSVAGKTGTAQKPGRGGYVKGKWFASFVGYLPSELPEICIIVTLDEPKGEMHQGGQAAAPVFKEIAEEVAHYLNIRPDIMAGATDEVVRLGLPLSVHGQSLRPVSARARD